MNLAVASALFVVWDLFLVVRHQNWLLHNGVLIDNYLTSLKPISFEGFKIAPFSGVYLLHSLWMYPFALWIAAGVALFRARELPVTARRVRRVRADRRHDGFADLRSRATLVLQRAIPHVRFAVLDGCRVRSVRPAPLDEPAADLRCRRTRRAPLPERHDHPLDRARRATRPCSRRPSRGRTHIGRRSNRSSATRRPGQLRPVSARGNYISYLLRRPLKDITYVPRRGSDFHGYVFTTTAVVPIGEVVWRDEPLILVKVP